MQVHHIESFSVHSTNELQRRGRRSARLLGMPAGDAEPPGKQVERSASSGPVAAKPLLPDGSAGFKSGFSCGR